MTRFHPPTRRGFTLIELLVVILIIGLLMGILLPAVQTVREKAKVVSAFNDMSQLSTAVANFQTTYNAPPPPTSITMSSSMSRTSLDWIYLTRVWPRLDITQVPTRGLDGNQSMVFFLGGFADGMQLTGFVDSASNPFLTNNGVNKKTLAFFEFPSSRMDGLGRFLDPWGMPYFYMGSYNGNDYNHWLPPPGSPVGTLNGACYLTSTPIGNIVVNPFTDSSTTKYFNQTGCQIISAGADGKKANGGIGPGGAYAAATNSYAPGKNGFDDLANFHTSVLGVP